MNLILYLLKVLKNCSPMYYGEKYFSINLSKI